MLLPLRTSALFKIPARESPEIFPVAIERANFLSQFSNIFCVSLAINGIAIRANSGSKSVDVLDIGNKSSRLRKQR